MTVISDLKAIAKDRSYIMLNESRKIREGRKSITLELDWGRCVGYNPVPTITDCVAVRRPPPAVWDGNTGLGTFDLRMTVGLQISALGDR